MNATINWLIRGSSLIVIKSRPGQLATNNCWWNTVCSVCSFSVPLCVCVLIVLLIDWSKFITFLVQLNFISGQCIFCCWSAKNILVFFSHRYNEWNENMNVQWSDEKLPNWKYRPNLLVCYGLVQIICN